MHICLAPTVPSHNYPVRTCAAQQGQAIGCVCMYIYMQSKVMVVAHLSPQKNLSAGVSLHLHVTQLVRYSWWVADQTLFLDILFIHTHTVSPHGFMGSIYAHSYSHPILVRFSTQCIQRTGLCVPWTLVGYFGPPAIGEGLQSRLWQFSSKHSHIH